MTNGDRMSGRLVSIALGTWTFRHAGGDLKGDLFKVVEKYYGAARLDVFASPALFFSGLPHRVAQTSSTPLRRPGSSSTTGG